MLEAGYEPDRSLEPRHGQLERVVVAESRALGQGAWAEDPRFSRFADRLENRPLIQDMLDGALGKRTTAEWLEVFAGAVPAAPINDIRQALDNPFVTDHGRIQTLTLPGYGDFRMVAPPVRCEGDAAPARAAPGLGADTDAILGDMGYDAGRIEALRAEKVI